MLSSKWIAEIILSESRRLFVDPKRFLKISPSDQLLELEKTEIHYLRRVLRLRNKAEIEIVDGRGGLWKAFLQEGKFLKLINPLHSSPVHSEELRPLICVAVVVPKRGFDEALRMCCEIGVDVIQPLYSERGVVQNDEKFSRWLNILKEAVEQSERLWIPKLLPIVDSFQFWPMPKSSAGLAVATTRIKTLPDFSAWLNREEHQKEHIWIAIGPEGGWTETEEKEAVSFGWQLVQLGDLILRTSTAAVSATQLMASWRRNTNFG
ncbi:16S rRNA (uracil(1498)-N(3))-methyltransferase [Prochlorococcus sp. MIT 1300]|uniref:16S rRNA (uracil(1498)-N(3))-methyltransferase n=1 Tax=Prochlorococcus sp. MIT 1300 TaxID=3096218 RepID=UPI002A75E9F9|nr:16S rRNA (uracil(1498)-N(3))-methyltransferase [Prochlorococcus sp. MIT 1300]